jgi:hypothetical protein
MNTRQARSLLRVERAFVSRIAGHVNTSDAGAMLIFDEGGLLENATRWLDRTGEGGILPFQQDSGFAKDRFGRMPASREAFWLSANPAFFSYHFVVRNATPHHEFDFRAQVFAPLTSRNTG